MLSPDYIAPNVFVTKVQQSALDFILESRWFQPIVAVMAVDRSDPTLMSLTQGAMGGFAIGTFFEWTY